MAAQRSLRPWLALRIALAAFAPLVAVAALIVTAVLPQLRTDLEVRYQTLAQAIAGRTEAHLLGAGRQLLAIAEDMARNPAGAADWTATLDAHAGTGDVFSAIYATDARDTVRAVGLPIEERNHRVDLVGLDLSRWPALREARERKMAIWSETFLSAVTGRLAVTLAIPAADRLLVGEIALDRLSEFLGHVHTDSGMLTMILDRQGQLIAHSHAALGGQQSNLGHLPVLREALAGQPVTRSFELDHLAHVGTAVRVPELGWVVLVAQPQAEAFRPFRSTLWVLAAVAVLASLLVVLVAWALARGFARRIHRYTEQVHAIANGDYGRPWPTSRIRELDRLAEDLERMSSAIRQRERDLATSEARYRSVIDNAPLVIFQFDDRGIFALSEGKALARIGLRGGEAVGRSVFEVYRDFPDICDRARRAISGQPQHYGYQIAGTAFDVHLQPVRGADDRVQVMGLAVDITERQRAEEALRQANVVVENSPVILLRWRVAEDWPVVFVSDNVTQFGYSPAEFLDGSLPFASVVHPEDRPRIREELARNAEGGADHFQMEYRILTRDGRVRWVDDRTAVERDASGRIAYHQGILLDVTDRRLAEEALRASEARFRDLSSMASDWFWEQDDKFRFTFFTWSGTMSDLERDGAGQSDLIGRTRWELPIDLTHEQWAAHRRVLEDHQPFRDLEYSIRTETGGTRWFNVNGRPLFDDSGRFTGYRGTGRDISDRKHAEEALRRGNRQLRILSHCNQALIRTTDETELLATVCLMAVTEGGYRMAWVGYRDDDPAGPVRPVAHAGLDNGYLQDMRASWLDGDGGPAATAMHTGKPCLVQDLDCESGSVTDRDAAARRGFASACALPLAADGRPFGALVVYAATKNAFDPEEVLLLTELANDLAFGVAALRARLAHERINQALQQNEFFLRKSQEVGELGSYLFDARKGLWINSPMLDSIFGIDESYPRTVGGWIALVHPEDRDAMLGYLNDRVLTGLEKFDREYRIVRHADHALRWVHGIGEMEFDEAGMPLRMIVTIQDITRRKEAERAMAESERKYRELVENANSIILRWSPKGEITFLNEFGLHFFGYSPAELVGQNLVGTLVPPDESTGRDLRPLMEEISRNPQAFEHNINENQRKNGERVWVAWTNKAVLDEQGRVAEVFSVGTDITDRKRAEDELRRHREHLEELVAERTAELRRAMNHLVQSEKLAALGSLVAGVAHELNTPLGNARVVASALEEDVRALASSAAAGTMRRSHLDAFLERGRAAAAMLERNTVRAADMIEHFKQVAVDQASTRRRSFDLRQTIEEFLTALQPQFRRIVHAIDLDIPAGIEMDSYPGPLEQVIANLVTNSLVHGFAGRSAGRIALASVETGPQRVVLRYSDDGVGIPPEHLRRIFEPFFTTRMGLGGSGLGLYIVYNLVTGLLGGTIEAASPPGGGAAFTIGLPLRAPEG